MTETLGLKNENPPHEGVAIVDSDTPLVYDILGDFLETLDRNGYTAKIEIIRK